METPYEIIMMRARFSMRKWSCVVLLAVGCVPELFGATQQTMAPFCHRN